MRRTIASLAVTGTCLITMVASANTITFETPSGSHTGPGTSNPVDAKAIFTTSANTLTITLENLITDPKDVAQNISAVGFTISTSQTAGSLFSSSGATRTVKTDGSYTDGAAVATGWLFSNPASGGILLDDLAGGAGPKHTIIGGPDASNKYGSAGGSIAKTGGPHNPFLVGDVTFTLQIAGLTSDSSISSMFFQFGTTDGDLRITVRPPPSHGVPDGGTTVALLGGALSTLAFIRRKLS